MPSAQGASGSPDTYSRHLPTRSMAHGHLGSPAVPVTASIGQTITRMSAQLPCTILECAGNVWHCIHGSIVMNVLAFGSPLSVLCRRLCFFWALRHEAIRRFPVQC